MTAAVQPIPGGAPPGPSSSGQRHNHHWLWSDVKREEKGWHLAHPSEESGAPSSLLAPDHLAVSMPSSPPGAPPKPTHGIIGIGIDHPNGPVAVHHCS